MNKNRFLSKKASFRKEIMFMGILAGAYFLIQNSLFAQEYGNYFILYDTLSGNKSYVARDYVKLSNSFYYKANNGGNNEKFSAKVDPFLVAAPNTGIVGGPAGLGGVVGNDGVVGATKGNFVVTDGGQAVYNIPLEFPTGIGGMSPDLSLQYISNGPDGLLGPGWGLGGLSVISLVPPTRYYNTLPEASSGLDYLENNYSLDGQKLIKVGGSGNTNNWEYRTENDNFAIIKRIITEEKGSLNEDGTVKDNSVYSFSVEHKNGLTYYYGQTINSRQGRRNSAETIHVVNYYISSIVDRYGNKILFNYSNNLNTGEIYLKDIYYPSVAGQEKPDSSNFWLEFKYIHRNSPIVTNYLYNSNSSGNSYSYKLDSLISEVKCHCNNQEVKSYKIEYHKRGESDFITETRTDYIKSIQEIGLNGEKYNKTVFDWEGIAFIDNIVENQYSLPAPAFSEYRYHSSSDTTHFNLNDTIFHAFRKNIDHVFIDVNNDHILEIVRTYEMIIQLEGCITITNEHFFVIEILEKIDDEYLIKESHKIHNYDSYHWWPCGPLSQSMFSFGDFNGDGLVDISMIRYDYELTQLEEKEDSQKACQFHYTNSKLSVFYNQNGSFENQIDENPSVLSQINGFYSSISCDLNGDAISDLILCNNVTGSKSIKLGNRDNPLSTNYDIKGVDSLKYSINLTNLNPIQIVDFNGDGRHDIIEKNTSRQFVLHRFVPESGIITMDNVVLNVHDNGKFRFTNLNTDKKLDLIDDVNIHLSEPNSLFEFDVDIKIRTVLGDGKNFNNTPNEFTYQENFKPDCANLIVGPGGCPYFNYCVNTESIDAIDITKDGQCEIFIRYVITIAIFGNVNEEYKYHFTHILYPNKQGDVFTVKKFPYDLFSREDPSYPLSLSNSLDIKGNQQVSLSNFDDIKGNQQPCFYEFSDELHYSKFVKTYELEDYGTSISKITDALGNEIIIQYGYTASTEGLYSNTFSDTNTYPVTSLNINQKLVSKVRRSNGLGSFLKEEYKYEDALCHNGGLGYMGFKKVIKTDVSLGISEIVERSDWHNKYFYYQKEKRTQQLNNGIILSEKTSNFSHKSLNSGKNYFVYEIDNLTKTKELNDSLIKVETNVNEYDNFGNLIQNTNKVGYSVDSLPWVRVLKNKYYEGEENKRLGRLERAEVEYRIAGVDTIIKRSAFKYYLATDTIHKGMLHEEIVEPGDDTLSTTKSYKYDNYGNIVKSVTSVTSVKDRSQTIEVYSSYHNQNPLLEGRFLTEIKTIGDEGKEYIVKKEYDAVWGNITKITDANNLVSSAQYDGFGNKLKEISPDGSSSVTVLRWVQEGDPDAPQYSVYYIWSASSGTEPVKIYYSSKGNELRTVTVGMDGSLIYVDTYYDDKGRLLKKSEPYFSDNNNIYYTEYLLYDELNRLRKVKHPDGGQSEFKYEGLTKKVVNAKNQTSSKTYNPAGWLIESKDAQGNIVKLTHRSDGLVTKRVIDGHENTKREYDYDKLGNLKTYYDLSQGLLTYNYNAFGQLVFDVNAKGDTTSYEYDKLGRLKKKIMPGEEGTIEWVYYDTPGKMGLLKSVTNSNLSHSIEYKTYDTFGRLIKKTESIFGEEFDNIYSYDNYGRLETYTFPETGLTIQNHYNSAGYQVKITNASDGSNLWQALSMNARSQYEGIKLGNLLGQQFEYYGTTGLIKKINCGNFQNEVYTWDEIGNLDTRKSKNGKTEVFGYDELSRLTNATIYSNAGLLVKTDSVRYDAIGNITYKTGVGVYEYDKKLNPYKLLSVNGVSVDIDPSKYELEYTSFNKVSVIRQYAPDKTDIPSAEMNIFYGIDNQRIKQTLVRDLENSETKVYVGNNFEKQVFNGAVKYVHYISSPSGIAAIIEQDASGTRKVNHVLCDHLGSIQVTIDVTNNSVFEYSYDPWGLRRDPLTWEVNYNSGCYNSDRGYTGHEHIDMFMMINMNGRIYDPLIGVFLSPDPVLQFADFSQGLHPYAYCLNNPLRYIDPEGYSLFGQICSITLSTVASIIFADPCAGILVSSIVNTIDQAIENNTRITKEDFARNLMMSFMMAFVNTSIGNLFEKINIKGFEKELLRALTHGTKDGLIRYAQGGKFEHGFMSGFVSSLGGSYVNDSKSLGYGDKVLLAAAIGGTAEKLGGGKFANGAVTGAYVMMFNHMGDHGEGNELKPYREADKFSIEYAKLIRESLQAPNMFGMGPNPFLNAEAIYGDIGLILVGGGSDVGFVFVLAGDKIGTLYSFSEIGSAFGFELGGAIEIGRYDVIGLDPSKFNPTMLQGDFRRGSLSFYGLGGGLSFGKTKYEGNLYKVIGTSMQFGISVNPFYSSLGGSFQLGKFSF